jgi:broad specificity phosphatase PhoE
MVAVASGIHPVSILAIRHGSSAHNTEGPKERTRGWLDLDITKEGRREAKEAAQETVPFALKAILCSDLKRSVETAHIVASLHPSIPVVPSALLRPLNIGTLAGELYSKATPIFTKHIAHPDRPLPNGESVNQFAARCLPLLQTLIESDLCWGVIVHTWQLRLMNSISASHGRELDYKVLAQTNEILPGEVALISQDYTISPLASSPPVPQTKAGSLS